MGSPRIEGQVCPCSFISLGAGCQRSGAHFTPSRRKSCDGASAAATESTPPGLIAPYDSPARDRFPPVKLTWHDGGKRPQAFAENKLPTWGDGVLFVGAKGMLIADYTKHRLLPEKDFEGHRSPSPSIADSVGHHKEWVEACKSGGPTTCNFDYGGALTEAVLLGNVAYRLGQSLEWDAVSPRATNAPEAEKYLRREYRKPWTL